MNSLSVKLPLLLIITAHLFIGCQRSQQEYYKIEDFESFEKIDAHTHLNTVNPIVIEEGIDNKMKMITLNTDVPTLIPIQEQRKVAVQLKEKYSDRLAYTTAFTLDGWNDKENWQDKTLRYLKDSFEKGAFGVKVWKNIGMEFKDSNGEFIMIDNPQFDPIFEFLSNEKIPLYAHIGEPKNCWLPLDEMTVGNDRDYFENHPQYHMYLHPEYPSYEDIIQARDNVLKKHPDLVVFGAHLGSMEWSIDMMSEHLDKYPNLILGMAHRIPHLEYLAQQDREKLRNFFIDYQDRLIYSTDLQLNKNLDPEEVRQLAKETWRNDWEFFVTDNTLEAWQVEGKFQGLYLPKKVIDKLYYENVRHWMPNSGL